jgi:hypothetical protein
MPRPEDNVFVAAVGADIGNTAARRCNFITSRLRYKDVSQDLAG